MTTAFRPALFRPLPLPVLPVPNETLASYWAQLAEANWSRESQIRYPSPWLYHPYSRTKNTAEELSILTGLSPARLRNFLPELRWLHETGYSSPPPGMAPLVKRRWACRRCTAARGRGHQVQIWDSYIHRQLCRRHRLWTGEAVNSPAEQADLHGMDATVRSQELHSRLIRHHGIDLIAECHRAVLPLWKLFAGQHYRNTPINRRPSLVRAAGPRTRWGPELFAAAYPETIAVITMATTPKWRSLLERSMYPADVEQFLTELKRRLPENHIMQTSETRGLRSKIGAFVRRVARYSTENHAASAAKY
ncbi:hypothetical protein ACGFY9_07215 [Streptomyces sp. NPDC048504]|uniref:hypothetical protein n=1 Tax=Streptomyces sp. NPDC048504 TaxID=3365559 RepID=UPI0037155485